MKSASLGPQRTKCISAIEVWDQDIRRSANPAGDTTLSELGTFVIEVIFTIMEEAPFCDVPSNYRFAPRPTMFRGKDPVGSREQLPEIYSCPYTGDR
jgi:hypothetical protein